MALEPIPAYSGFRGGQIGQAYNEAAFRYFLAVDRLRAERMQRSILLVLASIRPTPGRSAHLTRRHGSRDVRGVGGSVSVKSISSGGIGKAESPAPCWRRPGCLSDRAGWPS